MIMSKELETYIQKLNRHNANMVRNQNLSAENNLKFSLDFYNAYRVGLSDAAKILKNENPDNCLLALQKLKDKNKALYTESMARMSMKERWVLKLKKMTKLSFIGIVAMHIIFLYVLGNSVIDGLQ